jgi:hypothetical protein
VHCDEEMAMKILFKITENLLEQVHSDLARPHAFAAERVGFLNCKVGLTKPLALAILAREFSPVDDDDYLDDPRAGATIGPAALRKALQLVYKEAGSMFHIHVHDHPGRPWFSYIDLHEGANFVPDFWHVRPELPHGALVLSRDSVSGLCWVPGKRNPIPIQSFTVVGFPMRTIRD